MKLMTKELEERFRQVGSQEDVEDPIVIAKFFAPTGGWTWYATEYEPKDKIFFGLVHGFEEELGYFGLKELESIKFPLGLGIERDLYCGEMKMSEIKRLVKY